MNYTLIAAMSPLQSVFVRNLLTQHCLLSAMLHVDCSNTKYGGEFKTAEQVWHVRNYSFETNQAGTVFDTFLSVNACQK